MDRPQLRHERAADDHERRNRRHGGQPPNVDVDSRPELDERETQERDEQKVEDDRAERTPRTALIVAIAIHGVVQRAQLVVLLTADDLVRADDLLTGEDIVLRVGDRPAHLVATKLRRGAIRHDRRMEERCDQAHVERIAGARSRVGMDQAGARHEHVERGHAVGCKAAVLAAGADDDLPAHGVEHARTGDSRRQPAIEHATDGGKQRRAVALRRQIRCFAGGQLQPPTRRGALNRRGGRLGR